MNRSKIARAAQWLHRPPHPKRKHLSAKLFHPRTLQQITHTDSNSLAGRLKIAARLIKGGLQTNPDLYRFPLGGMALSSLKAAPGLVFTLAHCVLPITNRYYLVSHGSFDTHSLQTSAADTTVGTHATLLGNVSAAIKAFPDDLKYLGVEERVVGMTYSEFGRRIKSNASGGTDHGAAAPMFIFGKNVTPGVLGTNPAIPAAATVNDNVPFQYDFRSVYASLLQRWFCVPDTDLQMVMMKDFQQLNLVNNARCKTASPSTSGDTLITNYPNPFTESTKIQFTTAGGHTLVQIMNGLGQVMKVLVDADYPAAGTYSVPFNSYGLPGGVYYARLQNGPVQQVRTMLKVR